VTEILKASGNLVVDKIIGINTITGNTFFHRLGQYDQMIVFARSGNDVPTVIEEMNKLYGNDSLGIEAQMAD